MALSKNQIYDLVKKVDLNNYNEDKFLDDIYTNYPDMEESDYVTVFKMLNAKVKLEKNRFMLNQIESNKPKSVNKSTPIRRGSTDYSSPEYKSNMASLSDYYKKQEKEANEKAKQEEEQLKSDRDKAFSDNSHEVDLGRIKEETQDNTLTSILHTLGVPVPDKLFKDARTNKYAQEDKQSILDRASTEDRDLTDAEDKQVKTLEKQIVGTQKAADIAAKLPPELLAFSTALAGAAVAVGLMNKAGTEAVKRMNEVNKSLAVLGESSAQFSGTSNLQYVADQNWKEISNDLIGIFAPVTGLLSSISWGVSSILKQITDGLSFNADDISSEYTGWYTGEMQGENGIVVSELNQTLSMFIKAFKDQGMSNTSASNMAVKLHNLTWNQANDLGVTGQSRDKMMQDALSAVTTGGGFSEYGWNTGNNVLTGYLNEQGIDNVNVGLTDAMESYHRLMLMQEQQSFDSNDALSKQIRDWEKLGMQIDASKGKLLSFDEELVLSAIDNTIPEFSMPEVENSQGTFGGTGRDISNLISPEDIDNTINKLKEYWDTLNLTPEEKETYLRLIDDESEQIIAAYLDKLGMTPEQITTALKAYQESPEKFIEYLSQQGVANENINELIQLLEDAGVVSEDWADKATQAAKEVGDELDKTNDKAKSLLETLGKLLVAMAEIALGEVAGAGIRLSNKFMSDTAEGQAIDNFLEGTWIRDWDKKVADNWNNPNKTKMTTEDAIKNFDILSPTGSKDYRNYMFTGETPDDMLGHAEGGLSVSEHIAWFSEGNKAELNLPLEDSRTRGVLAGALKEAGAGGSGGEPAPQVLVNVIVDGAILFDDMTTRKFSNIVKDTLSEEFQRTGVPWK